MTYENDMNWKRKYMLEKEENDILKVYFSEASYIFSVILKNYTKKSMNVIIKQNYIWIYCPLSKHPLVI